MRSAEWREIQRIWNDRYIRQQIELAEQVHNMNLGSAEVSRAPAPRSLAADRKAAVLAYKAEVLSKTGHKLKYADIWIAAHYKDKSVFYRWLAGKCESPSIERVLHEKPHLKPPSKPPSGHLP
jgi:hypothetical protein